MEDLGKINLEEELERRKETLFVPNWFSCDIRTGVSTHAYRHPGCLFEGGSYLKKYFSLDVGSQIRRGGLLCCVGDGQQHQSTWIDI